MDIITLFIIAVGLSMDAFAVSICKGMVIQDFSLKKATVIGLWFGCFQAIMPAVGYLFGNRYESSITIFDHWIAFILLSIIGTNMIKEALSAEEIPPNASLALGEMFVLALATSIDALAVGVSLAFLKVPIGTAAALIGTTTFALSIIGVKTGNLFGFRYKAKAEMIGGIILILMGIKIVCEHLGLFS